MVPSVMTSILADEAFVLSVDARKDMLAGVSAVCLLGKVLGGLITDAVGGWTLLVAVFICFTASSFVLTTTTSVATFGAMWWLNSLAYTVTWGAACQIIGASYEVSERPAQLTRIASASRFGASLGSMFFGRLLKAGLHWRQALMPTGIVQALLAVLCTLTLFARRGAGKESGTAAQIDASKAAPPPPSRSAAWAHVATIDFWLMFIPKIVIFTYTQFFMNFLAPYLHSSFGYSHGDATTLAGLCSGGSVIGLLVIGDRVYKKMSLDRQAALVFFLVLVCLLISALLAFSAALPFDISPLAVPLLFVWGLAYALPFYLPPGEFALRIGGKTAAALFTNLFDAGGFTVSFFWNRWATKSSKDGDFAAVLQTLSLFALISLGMPWCMYRQYRSAEAAAKKAA
uniref:Major facilitator superfamily (MFS) profile domain-containing protein n=1 Tax=Calcidiscus leptoporus TaxID=127549 RepID=A0A7S0P042_9EUKA